MVIGHLLFLSSPIDTAKQSKQNILLQQLTITGFINSPIHIGQFVSFN